MRVVYQTIYVDGVVSRRLFIMYILITPEVI